MRTQLLAGVFILGCAVALIGQGPAPVDLEGVWDFSTITLHPRLQTPARR